MIFEHTDGFCKDLKALGKRFRSLPNDLDSFCRVLSVGRPDPRLKHTAMLAQVNGVSIWKMRFFCKYLKGSSLRVVFAYFEDGSRVDFLEMYFRGDKDNEDAFRYEEYLKQAV